MALHLLPCPHFHGHYCCRRAHVGVCVCVGGGQITESLLPHKDEIYLRIVHALRNNIDQLRPLLRIKHDTTMYFKSDFVLLGGEASRVPDEVREAWLLWAGRGSARWWWWWWWWWWW